ncbi:MAG: hypothetical protein SCJ93_01315 [Bacillota bacterium]|nr:hypothetical protein [Bacillota bacterium]
MSAFLGPIHYWLYNKVQWHEELLQEIVDNGNKSGNNTDILVYASKELYGERETRPLAAVIEEGNIHGWLQERIESLEYRMAYIITNLLKEDALILEEIKEIYIKNGKKAYQSLDKKLDSAEEVFKSVYDFLIDGMPCDRVNKPVESGEDYFKWLKPQCLHIRYWEAVGGDIEVYNKLRRVWIDAFVPADFEFEGSSEGDHEIRRTS